MTQDEKDTIKKLETFLKANNIELDYVEDDENYFDLVGDRITINRSQSPTDLIYTILHELGHYFSDFHPNVDTKATLVIEEVLAWDIGRDMSHTLGIDIDDDKWQELMISCITEYIEK